MQLSASHGLDGALADSKDNQDSLHHLPDGALADSKDNQDRRTARTTNTAMTVPFAISSSFSLPRLLLGASAGLPASLTLGASGHLVERRKLVI